jgi:hypothetical protein
MPLPTVSIAAINALPNNAYNGTGKVGILITNNITSYYQVIGSNLNRIVSVKWYPENAASVLQTSRNMILIDDTQGTFAVTVLNNYLNDCNRAGYISFGLDDGTTLQWPVVTYGPLSLSPIWTAPDQGLITG